MGVLPFGLALLFAQNILFGPTRKQVIVKRDSLVAICGVVDTLFNDKPNHNVRTAVLTNKLVFQINPEWESKIEIGDSLNKVKGSFILEVYKKNGKKVILDYKTTFPSN